MKKYFILAFITAFLWSCDDDSTSDVSQVTNYPSFEVIGDRVIYVPKGGTFNDPGVIVTEGENEIDYTTSASGTYFGETSVNTDVSDVYTVTYSAVNQDGFSGSASRTVIVYEDGDLVTSIGGVYRATSIRNGAAAAQYTDMEFVLITENEDGTYNLTDAIGAYYDIGRAYGAGYAAPVTFTANNIPGNSFTFPTTEVGTFGGPVVVSDFTVNAGAGTITFTSVWQADAATVYTFAITLEKVEF